jgi:hypothetical protein
VSGVIAAVECFISEFPLVFDLGNQQRDQLGGPIGEAGSIGLAVVTAPGTVNIMNSLEVLGDFSGVHAAPADSVLFGERLSKDYAYTDGIVPRYWDFVFRLSVPVCEALCNGCGQRSRSFCVDKNGSLGRRSRRNGGRYRTTWSQVSFLPEQLRQESGSSGLMRCRIRPTGSQP